MDAQKQDPGAGFFAVEATMWARVCSLGFNEAIAYLVIASGTGRDNRTTSWSTFAVRQRTGMARGRAEKAVAALLAAGMMRKTAGGKRPAYYLASESDLLRSPGGQESGPELIWLPNSLITGVSDEVAPLKLLRQSQNPVAVRLFVDLYFAQNLADDGGIHWRTIRRGYLRHRMGERGEWVIWRFEPQDFVAWKKPPIDVHCDPEKQWGPFWQAWFMLVDLGLVEIVAHLVEADNDNSEIIHPCDLAGDDIDRSIAEAAQTAGIALLRDLGFGDPKDLEQLVPAARALANVAMVGIARLRYRPRTKMTAAWASNRMKWQMWADRYGAIATSPPAISKGQQYQRGSNIKEGSTRGSMRDQRRYYHPRISLRSIRGVRKGMQHERR